MARCTYVWVLVALLVGLPPDALAQEAPEPDEPPPVLTGTLVGHDGTALSASHVHVRPYRNERTRSVAVGPDRSFRVALDTTGVVTLRFTGRNHSMQERTVLARPGDTIGVDVRLGTFARPDSLTPTVFGAFNDFSLRGGTLPMTEQPDGTYAVTVPSPGDSLTYGIEGAHPDGTQFDQLVYARRGNYRPVVAAPSDSTTVTYDPDAVPRSDTEPRVRFRDSASTAARYAAFVEEVEARREAFIDAMRAADGQDEQIAVSDTFDWSPNRKRLEWALRGDPPAAVANAYRMMYLSATIDADSTVAKKVLSTVPAAAPLWSLNGGRLFRGAVYTVGELGAYEDFAYKILRETPSSDVRAATLSVLLRDAAEADETEKKRLLYAWMEAEHADTRYAQRARAQFAPDRPVQVGKPVPSFSVTALRDTTKTFSAASFEGQYVLLDFWATWCGPCIDEFPTLRTADSTYAGDNFTILSLSLDASRSTVTDFLKDRKMPWKHAFAEGGFESDVANQFEVVGIPKPVLVGPDGQIVATEGDLRGEELLGTLEEHLGPASGPGGTKRSN